MDMRTGQMYSSKEAALLAGVPESDLAEVEVDAKGNIVRLVGVSLMKALGERHPSKYQPHQGTREKARRARRLARSRVSIVT